MAFVRLSTAQLSVAALVAISPAALLAQAVQRSMYVSVLSAEGTPVRDLGPADFVIREDGVAREVLHVEPAAEPMQIAVLVDNSAAADPYAGDTRRALEHFVTTMTSAADGRGRNEMTLITLASRPTTVARYTSSRTELLKGVGRIFAERQTGAVLLDAILEVSQGFKKREAERPAIVAIVTEGPQVSWRYRESVLGPLRDSGAALHAIVVGPFRDGTSDEDRDRNIVLDVGTRDTGGRLDHPLSGSALDSRLQSLADELTHQYRVTYAHPQSLIPPEHVTVSAARPGMKARGIVIKDNAPRQGRP